MRDLSRRSGRARWRRLLRGVVLAAVILSALYLVAANVLLRTRLLRDIISRPSGHASELTIDYASAYSVLPGRVHLEGVTLRGRERTVEWALALDHADVRVDLLALLHRQFHTSRLRSSGLTFRARLRLDRTLVHPEVVEALPPIAGYPDPPLLDEGPETPPPAEYKLWTIDMEDVDVEHVREVWVHTVRSQGDTHVHGRWLLRPDRWLDVGPATVEARDVTISYGAEAFATEVHGPFMATVHPFDVRTMDGLDFFDHLSYDGRLAGRALLANGLHLLMPDKGVTFRRGEGPFDGRVVLDHGTFSDGTSVTLDLPGSEIATNGLELEGSVHADVRVDEGLGTLAPAIRDLQLHHHGAALARVASAGGTLTSRHLRLAHPFDDARFTLDVEGAETPDLGAWKDYLPAASGLVLRSGKVTADGHADGSVADERGRGELHVTARRLAVERGHDELTADVTATARVTDASVAEGWATGGASIAADRASGRLGPALVAGQVAMQVDLRRGSWKTRIVDLSGSHVALRATALRSARSGRELLGVPSAEVLAPALVVGPAGGKGRVSIDVPRADLPHLGVLAEIVPMPQGFALEDGSGRVRAHATFDVGTGSIQGDGEVVTRAVRVRVGKTEAFGDLACVIKASRSGATGSATDLSGTTFALTHAGTERSKAADWWGSVALRDARLWTGKDLRFDGRARLRAKDATPATVLVADNTSAPKWATDVFRMPILDADGELVATRSSFEARSLVAHGEGKTSVHAEYEKKDGHQDGAVLMELGWINLAYDLKDGSTGLVLIEPQSWYARKTAALRGSAGRVDVPPPEEPPAGVLVGALRGKGAGEPR